MNYVATEKAQLLIVEKRAHQMTSDEDGGADWRHQRVSTSSTSLIHE